ncbi:MAG: hypothetical protein QM589_10790 [Thermomicrobiales bacterium]
MSKSKTISLGTTAPLDALGIVRRVVEARGYLWEPVDATSARAHQGGKFVTKKRDRRLLLDVSVVGQQLVLRRESNGSATFAANMGILGALKVNREFRKVANQVAEAITSSR